MAFQAQPASPVGVQLDSGMGRDKAIERIDKHGHTIPSAAKFMKMIEDNSHRISFKGMTWCQPVHLPSPAPLNEPSPTP
ncbi:hypothetical protein DSO57_1036179 [Entomophthora muscae]|uniref:Uncharacterized protein n=1 Tax=Entomophthora muscae TaxID=34485 RepID=A0ACC2SCF8_9FUNG|nr:hypothetical protein DSO57_1036179 [Entomophthora muscae]